MIANMEDIRARFNPHLLLDDIRTTGEGIPIVGDEGSALIAESGNGRIMLLRRYPEVYQAYREQLPAYAEQYGIPASELQGFQRPVLVRQRTTPMTPERRAEFVRTANQPRIAAMSAAGTGAATRQRLDT